MMMACEEFEDRLIDYAELLAADREDVDAHLAGCAECRAYPETLTVLDSKLAFHYSGVESPAGGVERPGRAVRPYCPSCSILLAGPPCLLDRR
ncbi:MAG: anti-sigma factor family protein [Bryobacteraceae bacterium]